MKKAYILHGCCDEEEYFSNDYPSPSNFHWLPWIQKQLLMKGYFCQTPEMPKPYKPRYIDWKKTFDLFPVDEETSLIGHSCSSGFFLHWLGENDQKIDKMILVAPWIDTNLEYGEFFKCILNSNLPDRVKEMHVFYSTDDKDPDIKKTTDIIMKNYPQTKLHLFNDKGHFTLRHMGTQEFPELLTLFD